MFGKQGYHLATLTVHCLNVLTVLIPRSNRLNFDNQEVKNVKGATMKGKAQEMERVALASVIELVDRSGVLNLEEVL